MHGDTYPYVVSVSFGMEIVDVKGCRGVSKLRHLCFFCIGNKNKPPAMQVCSQTALASSKKPPCYNEYKVRQPNHYNKEESKWTIIVYHTQNGHANII